MGGIRSIEHSHWKVTIHFRERETRSDSGDVVTRFESEGQARLAVEWAYAVRLAEVRAREDAKDIEECPLGEGSSNPWDRKLVWWKRVLGGTAVMCMKDDFMGSRVRYHADIVTEAPVGA